MSAPILHVGATMLCLHAGQAMPGSPDVRVSLGGQPLVTISSPYSIAGCTLPPPTAGNGPCVSASFVSAATRVSASGVPVLLSTSQAVCAPTGTGVNVVSAQVRVLAV